MPGTLQKTIELYLSLGFKCNAILSLYLHLSYSGTISKGHGSIKCDFQISWDDCVCRRGFHDIYSASDYLNNRNGQDVADPQ